MVEVAQVVYTDHDGNTLNIFTKNIKIKYIFEGLEINRRNGKIGITRDPIRQYRVITCTAKLTGTLYDTLDTQLMDDTKTYDEIDPKIVVQLGDSKTKTIYVATTDITADTAPDGRWYINFTFTERSA